MQTELTREEEIKPEEGVIQRLRDVIARLKPKSAMDKFFDELHERESEFFKETRRILNPYNKDLTLIYPASGSDIKTPLRATGATILVLIDMSWKLEGITKELMEMGAEVKKVSPPLGNKTEIDFEWEGKSRKVLFYELEIKKDELDKLPAEVKEGYDLYFELRPQGMHYLEIRESFINALKVGGFHLATSKEVDTSLGFEKVLLAEKFESYIYDDVRFLIHKKTQNRPAIKDILDFNELFSEADRLRHGGYNGIQEQYQESSLEEYRQVLIKLKKIFDSLPKELKEEFKPQIDYLHYSSGDMSKVHHSPEHWRRMFEERKARGRIPPENEIRGFEADIHRAEHSPHRPTEEQLEGFIKKGRKVFEEVLGSSSSTLTT